MAWEFLLLGLIGEHVRGYYSGKGKSGGGKFIGGSMGSKEKADEYSDLRKAAAGGDTDAQKKMEAMRDTANKERSEEKELVKSMLPGVRAQYRTAIENGNTEAARQLLQQQAKAKELAASLKGRGSNGNISIRRPENTADLSRQRINKLSFGVDALKDGNRSYLDGYKKEHPLNARILEVLPPKRNRTKVDKKLEEDFKQKTKGQTLDASSVRILAAMTPAEVIHHAGDTKLAVEFSKYAQRSGNYWKDSRTGVSFKLGDALKRELMEHDVARDLLKLKTHTDPGGSPAGQPNIWRP